MTRLVVLIFSGFIIAISLLLSASRPTSGAGYGIYTPNDFPFFNGLHFQYAGSLTAHPVRHFPAKGVVIPSLTNEDWLYYVLDDFNAGPQDSYVTLYRMRADGSDRQQLGRFVNNNEGWSGGDYTFSPDQQWMAYTSPAFEPPTILFVTEMASLETHMLLSAQTPRHSIQNFLWSQDSQWIYFEEQFRPAQGDMTSALYRINLQTQQREHLYDLTDVVPDAQGYTEWLTERSLFVRRVKNDGSQENYVLDLATREFLPVCGGNPAQPMLAGDWLICEFSENDDSSNRRVWRFNLLTHQLDAVTAPGSRLVAVTPDHQRIIYQQGGRNPEAQLFAVNIDGRGVQLIATGHWISTHQFVENDGQLWMVYLNNLPTVGIYRLSLDTLSIEPIVEAPNPNISFTLRDVSSDNQWILYETDDVLNYEGTIMVRLDGTRHQRVRVRPGAYGRASFSHAIDLPWHPLPLFGLGILSFTLCAVLMRKFG